MATLTIPDEQRTIEGLDEVQRFLDERGILLERWQAQAQLADDASQEEVLAAYAHRLDPYMEAQGYRSADVVVMYPTMPNAAEIRAKFLREHTHEEDEVRFFVDGSGVFWFHREHAGRDEVFNVRCERGDLLSVPAGVTHWFDCGEEPFVKAIRVFSNESGWVPHYTDSGIEQRYL